MGVHWRSSAVETQYEGTGRFTLAARLIGSTGRLTPAARLIGGLFTSRGLESGHGDPSLFHWLRLGSSTSFRAEPEF